MTPQEVIQKYQNNQAFYKRAGGITLSGGEPLIHREFCLEVCKLAFQNNISVALDTAGATFNDKNIEYYKQLI
ncbi:MAG: radical SAM protein, partial [Mycoplasmoidaceae bacterium]|nr:radical SAM protein [Mycoplasmoidaceae bacterium]